MLWTPTTQYEIEPFELETDLEKAINEVSDTLFGPNRIYLDVKKKIGAKGKINNIPDGYLIDLSSKKKPCLFVVENELARHDPLKHIAVQILQFSLSFESAPQKVKKTIRDTLDNCTEAKKKCEMYAVNNGFENLDYLLEKMIYDGGFGALVIIDELPDELEAVLVSRFKFPVEVITLTRYVNDKNERIYQFEPFLADINVWSNLENKGDDSSSVDLSEVDTVVVPAHEEGFQEVFLNENRWYAIRIHGSMIPKIKYVAAYRVAPVSAVTHVAPVKSIEQWKETNKYVLKFSEPAKEIKAIPLVKKGKVKALQNARYTSYKKLMSAENLDEAF